MYLVTKVLLNPVFLVTSGRVVAPNFLTVWTTAAIDSASAFAISNTLTALTIPET